MVKTTLMWIVKLSDSVCLRYEQIKPPLKYRLGKKQKQNEGLDKTSKTSQIKEMDCFFVGSLANMPPNSLMF